MIESYRLAAADVRGVELPAGAAWLAAWAREPELELYGPDEFHSTLEGSYLAALMIYAKALQPLAHDAAPPCISFWKRGCLRIGSKVGSILSQPGDR